MRALKDLAYAKTIVENHLERILFGQKIEAEKKAWMEKTALEHRHRWNAGIPGVPDPNTMEGASKYLRKELKAELDKKYPGQDIAGQIERGLLQHGNLATLDPGVDGFMERIQNSMVSDICGWCGVQKKRGDWCDNPRCATQKIRRPNERD